MPGKGRTGPPQIKPGTGALLRASRALLPSPCADPISLAPGLQKAPSPKPPTKRSSISEPKDGVSCVHSRAAPLLVGLFFFPLDGYLTRVCGRGGKVAVFRLPASGQG